ncbi:hypothetical protein E2562_021812 [Oryza meyeriana var. granulata]|uniref:Uncharacterized protein n=1 Tax=Oryza meyeriana var. granulata TaxID=110450 RepID=A0A6G1EN85_9ORYZ|nr:hypothetical protein E2562_021812 [Oryza meyeriana var. granulata]
MVASVVVQEAVGGAVSYLSSNREEKASERHNLEKLEMAHAQLEHALERSAKLPITDVSFLRQRRMFKRAYEECSEEQGMQLVNLSLFNTHILRTLNNHC